MTHANALFRTVARSDRFGFGSGESLDGRKVVDFLGFKKPELAKVAGVAVASVRFDQKMPIEVRERIEEIANVIELVAQFFDGDAARTALWFKTPNPMLGNISPRDMIRYGRYERLRRFVVDALDESASEARGTA